MKKRSYAVFILLWACIILAAALPAEAISFSTQGADESQSTPAPVVGGGPTGSPTGGGAKGSAFRVLDVPSDSKARLSEAMEMVQATGFQARLAMMKLEQTETEPAPGVEIAARLDHAYRSFEAMEKAAKRLEDRVSLTQLALEGRFGTQQRLLALLDLFSALPAEAFDDYDDMMPGNLLQKEFDKIAVGARLSKEKALAALSNMAKAVGDFAVNAKNAVKSGVSKVTGVLTTPIAYAHTKASQIVGWNTWGKMMAVTKFGAVVTVGTLGLVVAVTAMPATAVAAPLVAVGVWTAGNIGAGLSLVNDLNTIEGRSSPGLEASSYGISKGTALIGVVTAGNPAEIAVNVIGGVTDDMAVGRDMTEEELESFIEENAERMKGVGLQIIYYPPDTEDPYGGGEGGGGGCGDGCS